MRHGKSTATTEENYLCNCKNKEMITLYSKIRDTIFINFENVVTAATADYICWKIDGGRQFANFFIQKDKICILTLEPMRRYNIGERVPDTHLWTLNYKINICTVNKIEEVKDIICESYNKVR